MRPHIGHNLHQARAARIAIFTSAGVNLFLAAYLSWVAAQPADDLDFVDHLINAAGGAGDGHGGDAVMFGRHSPDQQHPALDHLQADKPQQGFGVAREARAQG